MIREIGCNSIVKLLQRLLGAQIIVHKQYSCRFLVNMHCSVTSGDGCDLQTRITGDGGNLQLFVWNHLRKMSQLPAVCMESSVMMIMLTGETLKDMKKARLWVWRALANYKPYHILEPVTTVRKQDNCLEITKITENPCHMIKLYPHIICVMFLPKLVDARPFI